jgi:hypothetical protein
MPHLIVTAGNDQHLRIWDTRHLSSISPRAVDSLAPPPASNGDDTSPRIDTSPTSSLPYEKVGLYMESKKGRGLLRASYQHGKSCSAAYWDPWGRRILTTSYDDKLRSERIGLMYGIGNGTFADRSQFGRSTRNLFYSTHLLRPLTSSPLRRCRITARPAGGSPSSARNGRLIWTTCRISPLAT